MAHTKLESDINVNFYHRCMSEKNEHENNGTAGVAQLRVIAEVEDHEAAVTFFRDVLGLEEQVAFEGEGDARVAILNAGRATLELSNPAQKRLIDEVETGQAGSPPFRLAFEVSDTRSTTARLVAAGAPLLGAPTVTPWRSLNARLDSPAGLQVTLFEELTPLAERESSAEFATDESRRA
jgi:catechol 2,3-dioxygenase-like lactoylglutathione lyase family enzyme